MLLSYGRRHGDSTHRLHVTRNYLDISAHIFLESYESEQRDHLRHPSFPSKIKQNKHYKKIQPTTLIPGHEEVP